MKSYKLKQDYRHPKQVVLTGTVKTAKQWFWDVFEMSYSDVARAENGIPVEETWCDAATTWLSAVPSHPTKEEIIDGEFDFCLTTYHDKKVLKCLEKHEESIKQQLIEKINSVEFAAQQVKENQPLHNSDLDAISEIIRNFKSE